MKKLFPLFLVPLLACILSISAATEGECGFVVAPLSREFQEYVNGKTEVRSVGNSADGYEYQSGYRPSPLDLSHLRSADYSRYISKGRGIVLPRRYDLRETGGVTQAKNQEPYGTCWAYSAMGSLESTYLRRTGTPLDLSENHLAWYSFNDTSGFSGNATGGGFDNFSIAVLARWTGPVLESALGGSGFPSGPASNYQNRLHLENAYFLSLQFLPEYPRGTDEMRKQLIYENGGISVGVVAVTPPENSPYYDANNYAWYYNGPYPIPNHAVVLVGWDDDFPREKFLERNRPRGNGAWLAKNSWGQSFGDNGFYWISYEDLGVGDGVVYLAGETNNFDKNYGYDDLGWCNSVGTGNSDTAWMANVFKTGQSLEDLRAVSFYTTSNASSYEIYVYTGLADGMNPTSGQSAMIAQTGTLDLAGYHTVRLNSPVTLSANTLFSVAVKLKTPEYYYPIPIETRIQAYSPNAIIERGSSFASIDGNSWVDTATDSDIEGNVCLKAFTVINKTTPSSPAPAQPQNPQTDSQGDQNTQLQSSNGGGGCRTGAGSLIIAVIIVMWVMRSRRLEI
ncbi:MAG: lectin like domain-containing protein [Synergistaceae bacterium]|nr:lectin like domain-containing protein [Synergistaceae bacterium]